MHMQENQPLSAISGEFFHVSSVPVDHYYYYFILV